MEIPANSDSFLFFASLFLGFCIGFYYEIFRFFRLAFPHPACLTVLEDLCFFLPLIPTLIFFHYALNDGILRWFSLLGCLLGFLLYLQTVGKLLLRCSDRILFCIRWIFIRLFRIFLRPVGIVFKKITNCLYAGGKKIVIMLRSRQVRKRLLKEKKSLSRKAEKGFR